MSDTPRTDAQHAKWRIDDDPYTDMMKLACQLERELLRASVDAARWRIASPYMTAHNRSIVEGLIREKLPERLHVDQHIGNPGVLSLEAYTAPQGQTELGHFQELDSRYALGWNDAIEAAAVYCAHTLTENHPSISSYFRHAAINIRTLKLK